MIDPFHPGLYHLWSSGSVGLLAWLLMRATSSGSSSTAHGGSTSSTCWSQLRIPLLLAVWTHIIADLIEHGGLPRIASGLSELLRFLFG